MTDWPIGISVKAVNQSIAGGQPIELMDWDTLRSHYLLTSAVGTAQWAERHLAALQINIDTFRTDPANKPGLRADLDMDSGYHIFRIKTVPNLNPIRICFEKSVADVVTNLHAALGQFAWQLACDFAPDGQPADPSGVNFPICDPATPEWFTNRARQRMRKLVHPNHWTFIEKFQPYHGCDGRADSWTGPYIHPLFMLNKLANDHKHRLTQPVLLVPNQFSFAAEAFNIIESPQVFGNGTFMMPDQEFAGVGAVLELKAEVLRARLVPDTAPHIDQAGDFIPQIAMAEGRPAIATLQRIQGFVHLIFSEFSRQFP